MLRKTLLLAALCAPALGQTWSKLLNTDGIYEPHDVTVTTLDHTVVLTRDVAGWSTLTWLDANGVFREQLLNVFAKGVSARQDGGIYLVGRDWVTSRLWAGAMDASGNWLWQWLGTNTLDNNHLDIVRTTPDGGAVATGWRYQSAGNNYEMIVYRFDPSGPVIWSRRLGDVTAGDYLLGYDIDVFPDGKIVVSGVGNDQALSLLESNGTEIWSKSFDLNYGVNVAAAQNGRIAVTTGPYAMMFESDGTLVWQREYIPTGIEMYSVDCAAIPGGGLYIAGVSKEEGPGIFQAYSMRLTEDGDVVWRHVTGQGPSSNYQGTEAYAAPSGDLVGAAFTSTNANGIAVWAYRMSSDGTIDGCELAAFPTGQQASNVVPTPLTAMSWSIMTETPSISSFTATQSVWTATDHCKGDAIGDRYCDPGQPNSSGLSAVMTARGSDNVTDNDVTLLAYQLPTNQWGMFVTGMGTGTVTPPGSSGQLCLTGGTIYRFASSILNSGDQGSFELAIDVNSIPGLGPIQAGQTWNFQAWTRDVGSTSNFTDALSIGF